MRPYRHYLEFAFAWSHNMPTEGPQGLPEQSNSDALRPEAEY